MKRYQDRYAVLTDDEIKVIANELQNIDLGFDKPKCQKRKTIKDRINFVKRGVRCLTKK